MKFSVVLIFAFFATAVILAANAHQAFFFEQTGTRHNNIAISNGSVKQFAGKPFVAPARYGESMALNISSQRATNILQASLPENSCVQAQFTSQGKIADDPFLSINTDTKLVPASTNKLITAAVILSTLDPESTLDTSLLAEKKASALSKAYIRTSGDPSFVTSTTPPARRPEYLTPSNTRTFEDFANKAYVAGIRNIGTLVIDNTWFDLDSIEAGWADDKGEVGSLSALSADEGFDGTTLSPDADNHAAAILRASFLAKGITIGVISFGSIPDSLGPNSVLATTSSVSIKDLVSDILKTSDNVYAEQLLAAAVHIKSGEVNKESRSEFVKTTLTSLGIDISGYDFVNGSGYSTDARTTCSLETDVIKVMKTKDIDLTELSSHAGKDGTLTKRFAEFEDLHAKTGTLDGVTALTGSMEGKIVFSFISNGRFSDDGGKDLQGQVLSVLSSFPFVNAPAFPANFGE